MVRNVFGDNSAGRHHAVTANGDSGQYDGVGTYPNVIADDDRLGGNALLVNTHGRVAEIVVQRSHCDTLCQIDVAAYAYRTDDGTVNADARIIANGDVAYSIIDAAIRLNDAMTPQSEPAVGGRVHSYAMVYLRTVPPVLIQGSQKPYVPPRACVALVHYQKVQPFLQTGTPF